MTVTGCTGFHHVTLRSAASNAPVTFAGSGLDCKRIDPVPCIDQTGGSLTFTGGAVDRMAGVDTVPEPAWSVVGGGSLTFVHTPVQGAFGTTSGASSVQFARGDGQGDPRGAPVVRPDRGRLRRATGRGGRWCQAAPEP